jgi:predicted nuclease of predicted toxin-antitoxin system
MKFLVDAQLPPGLCDWLKERGHAAIHVRELGDEVLTDIRIASILEEEQAILVSKDEDFVTLRLPDRFAFLWLRCGNISNRGLAEWLDGQWLSVERRLDAGARFITLR